MIKFSTYYKRIIILTGSDTGADSVVGVAADKVRTRGVRADNTTEMTATVGMITVLIKEINLNVSGGKLDLVHTVIGSSQLSPSQLA